ncbi:hypothetical protein Tco_1060900, partial [Tanacetum coccineum]
FAVSAQVGLLGLIDQLIFPALLIETNQVVISPVFSDDFAGCVVLNQSTSSAFISLVGVLFMIDLHQRVTSSSRNS